MPRTSIPIVGGNAKVAEHNLYDFRQLNPTAGNIVFVDSGASASGTGLSPEDPVLTLDEAFAKCTASNGDIVYVLEGHAETYSTTGTKATADVAGVRVIGLGKGASRPSFTFSHADATWVVSANGVSFENLLFITGIDSVVTFATVSGDDFSLINCESRDTTDIEVISDFTISGDRPIIRGLFKNGYTGGNANARVLSLAGVDRPLIENCRFITKATTAIINFITTACTGVVIRDSVFLVTSTTNFSKDVVDTVTGSTWSVDGCFDLGAGSGFSGGSGAALAGDDVSAVATSVASVGTQLTAAVSSLTSSVVSAQTAIITACSN